VLFGGGSSGHCRPVEQLRLKRPKSKKDAEVAKTLEELQSLHRMIGSECVFYRMIE
jgi:hypothetical protein